MSHIVSVIIIMYFLLASTPLNVVHDLTVSVFVFQVTSQMEAANQADLVFVAVFPEHHSTLVELKPALAGKTLVDVSNGLQIKLDGPSHAEQLADLFPESFVVKGFNTISAWTLQMGPRDGSRQVGHITSPLWGSSDTSDMKSNVLG